MQFINQKIISKFDAKHRLNRLNVIVIIALLISGQSHAEHPLLTDNTDVQGAGNTQLEINSDQFRSKTTANSVERIRQQVSNLGLSYGLSPNLDLIINTPYVYDSQSQKNGFGDINIAAKWQIYTKNNLTLAVKPSFNLNTGNSQKGLGAEKMSHSLTLLAQYKVTENTNILFNQGISYQHPKKLASGSVNLERKYLSNSSIAITQTFGPIDYVLDAGLSSNPNKQGKIYKYALAGAIYHANPKLDIDFGYRKNWQDVDYQTFGMGLTQRW